MNHRIDRVALYGPSLRGGGAERVMVLLANGIAERGIDVDLVLADAQGPNRQYISASVRIVDLKCHRVLRSLPALVRYLRGEQPTALIAGLSHVNMVAVVARWLSRTRPWLILTEHNNVSHAQLADGGLRSKLSLWLMRRLYPRADLVVTVSGGVANDLARLTGIPRERMQVIYNPVDIDTVQQMSAEPMDHDWFEDSSIPIVLAAGRLSAQKDFATLIAAFAVLRRKFAARLVILGEGELREDLENQVRSAGLCQDILLPGYATNPFVWMRQASLFVMSSIHEGFGLVLVEAMACGTPVVSTDCHDGPAEILENGRWGELVPVRDVSALEAAMTRSLESEVQPQLAERARMFTPQTAVEQYLEAIVNGIAQSNE